MQQWRRREGGASRLPRQVPQTPLAVRLWACAFACALTGGAQQALMFDLTYVYIAVQEVIRDVPVETLIDKVRIIRANMHLRTL